MKEVEIARAQNAIYQLAYDMTRQHIPRCNSRKHAAIREKMGLTQWNAAKNWVQREGKYINQLKISGPFEIFARCRLQFETIGACEQCAGDIKRCFDSVQDQLLSITPF